MSDIKLIKLLNGEELLAEVIDTAYNNYTTVLMKNPVRVVVMPNKLDPKTPNIGFAPWAEFTDDKEIEISKASVMAIMNPIKEFLNQYQSMFGKVVTPTSGLILPGR